MLGRDPARALEPEPVELSHALRVRGHVDLVDGERHGLGGLAQRTRELGVVRQDPGLCIDHPEDRVGVADREPGLRLDRRGQPRLRLRVEPCGVDHEHAPIADLRLLGDPIARDPGPIFDQRAPVPRIAVE